MRRARGSAGLALRMIACVLGLMIPAAARPDDLSKGIELFYQRRFPDAILRFEKACARGHDGEACAWLAEALRREGRRAAADSAARVALRREPCNAFAHVVIADNSNPQYGDWAGSDADSAWAQVLQAVACDSTDGNAWLSVWVEAMRRGDRERELRAYRRLVGDRFLMPPILAYGRWLLGGLPEHSVLLVNGDMDTYPVLALQALEGLRPDVAVVNVSLLELDWYRRVVRDRYQVPMPFGAQALDDLGYDPTGAWIGASIQVENGWRDMTRTGVLGRPLVYSTTLPMDAHPERANSHRVLEGAHERALPWAPDAAVDTARVRASLRGLSAADFAGAWVSPRDRSPVRRSTVHLLINNVFSPALRYAGARSNDNPDDALAMMEWAVAFARRAGAPDGPMAELVQSRNALADSVRMRDKNRGTPATDARKP